MSELFYPIRTINCENSLHVLLIVCLPLLIGNFEFSFRINLSLSLLRPVRFRLPTSPWINKHTKHNHQWNIFVIYRLPKIIMRGHGSLAKNRKHLRINQRFNLIGIDIVVVADLRKLDPTMIISNKWLTYMPKYRNSDSFWCFWGKKRTVASGHSIGSELAISLHHIRFPELSRSCRAPPPMIYQPVVPPSSLPLRWGTSWRYVRWTPYTFFSILFATIAPKLFSSILRYFIQSQKKQKSMSLC